MEPVTAAVAARSHNGMEQRLVTRPVGQTGPLGPLRRDARWEAGLRLE